MPERLFQIFAAVKPGQSDNKTKKTPSKLFTGTPSLAAKKAMTVLCGKKAIKGACTLTITMREVKRVKHDGEFKIVPVLDSDNMQIMRKYKLKRVVNETPVIFEGTTPITFKYKTEIVESFGRVM